MPLFLPAIYVLVPAVATVLALVLAGLTVRRRPVPGALAFTAVFLAAAAWSLAYTLELLATTSAGTLFWGRVSYLGILTLPAAWLVFALAYGGHRDAVTPAVLTALAVVPAAGVGVVWLAPDFLWTATDPTRFEGLVVMTYRYGPAFWGIAVYSYTLLLAGLVVLARRLLAVPSIHRVRLGAIGLALLLPWVGNALFAVGVGPVPPLNLTHLGFALGGAVLVWALFHLGLFDLREAAREHLFQESDVALVLLDRAHRIIDLNPAAETLLAVDRVDAIDRSVTAVPPLDRVFEPAGDRMYAERLTLERDGDPTTLAVELDSIYYPIQQQVMGRMLRLREVE